MSGRPWLRRWRAVALLAGFATFWVPAAPAATSDTVVDENGCTAVVAPVQVPLERIRPLVPDDFKLAVDPFSGKATVRAFAEHCKAVTVNGVTRESTWGAFRADLALFCEGEPEGSKEAEECEESRPPVPVHIDDYQFFFVSDNPELIDLFRAVGATPHQAVLVEDLLFRLEQRRGGSAPFACELLPPKLQRVGGVSPHQTELPALRAGRMPRKAELASPWEACKEGGGN